MFDQRSNYSTSCISPESKLDPDYRGLKAWATCVWIIVFGFWNIGFNVQKAIGQTDELPASIDKNWDDVFTTHQGWAGGDGGGTVDLGNGRILWMFADSFIGGVANGKHAPGSHMINNVFSVQTLNSRSKPTQQEFDFAWGPMGQDGKPTAWLIPDPSIMSLARNVDNKTKPNGWFWPAGGGCVVDINGKQQLFVFLYHMGFNGKGGVWGFENIGGAMAVVENPKQRISQWNIRQLDLSFTKDALRGLEQTDKATPLLESNWGHSCIHIKDDGNAETSGFVFVYGDQHRKYKNRQLLLARVRPKEIEDFAKWEFYSGKNGWVADCDRVEPIADGIGAEFSIEQVQFQGKTKFVMVHSHHWFGTNVFVRTADAPEGPWSKPFAVYDVPDLKKSKNYFTYAARGHAMLSPEGHLLITYIVNSNDFWEMAGDASIYRPRCITVPLSAIFKH